jgi:hypothetical protein
VAGPAGTFAVAFGAALVAVFGVALISVVDSVLGEALVAVLVAAFLGAGAISGLAGSSIFFGAGAAGVLAFVAGFTSTTLGAFGAGATDFAGTVFMAFFGEAAGAGVAEGFAATTTFLATVLVAGAACLVTEGLGSTVALVDFVATFLAAATGLSAALAATSFVDFVTATFLAVLRAVAIT